MNLEEYNIVHSYFDKTLEEDMFKEVLNFFLKSTKAFLVNCIVLALSLDTLILLAIPYSQNQNTLC